MTSQTEYLKHHKTSDTDSVLSRRGGTYTIRTWSQWGLEYQESTTVRSEAMRWWRAECRQCDREAGARR